MLRDKEIEIEFENVIEIEGETNGKQCADLVPALTLIYTRRN